MTPERHRQVSEVFAAARRLDAETRRRYLDDACADDPLLRQQVEGFLARENTASSVFGTVGVQAQMEQMAAEALTGSERTQMPERIGRYDVIRRIGEGGMGTVFEARQDNPRRSVALKMIRPEITSGSLLRRFEHEAHVLGHLQHPAIAHIYEAGVADAGRGPQPFFAMELIRGPTLLEYANRNDAGVRARLELITKICDGVEHAHQKGVIHRDLKPANILVDDAGQPKILDFGVARLTRSDLSGPTIETHAGQLIGTVPYMSPEQVAGDPGALDTRSDVYALGVVAYELLSGHLPYDLSQKVIPEAARIIREQEPTRLSTLDRRLRGDIETMVAKALEKDSDRRYQSAAAMAEDIRRYLRDEPIVARPPSVVYQVRKLAKRHRAIVAGLATTFVALIAGLIVSLSMYGQAEQARADTDVARLEAEREAAKAGAINEFILEHLLESSNPWKPYGRDVRVQEALNGAAASVDDVFADEPDTAAAVHDTLGSTYNGLGLPDPALHHLEAALRIRQSLYAGDHADVAHSLHMYAVALQKRGSLEQAETSCREALAMYRRLFGPLHAGVAESGYFLGEILVARSDYEAAEPVIRDALRVCREIYDAEHMLVAQSINQLGSVLYKMGRYAEAEPHLRESLEMVRRLAGDDDPSVAHTLSALAAVLAAQDDLEQAAELELQALEIFRRQLGPDHPRTLHLQCALATTRIKQGRLDVAEDLLRETVAASRRVLGDDHQDTLAALNALAVVLHKSGQREEAEPIYLEALALSRELLGDGHIDTLTLIHNLAWLSRESGRADVAEPYFREAAAGFRAVLGAQHPSSLQVTGALAEFLAETEQVSEAADIYRELLRIRREQVPADDRGVLETFDLLSATLIRLGEFEEAHEVLTQSLKSRRAYFDEGDWRIAECESRIGRCMSELGWPEADAVLRESYAVMRDHPDTLVQYEMEALQRLIAHLAGSDREVEAAEYRTVLSELKSQQAEPGDPD